MDSLIHTFQIKDVVNVNGKPLFVWSVSFMSIGGKEKIKVKTNTGRIIEVLSLESLFINGKEEKNIQKEN